MPPEETPDRDMWALPGSRLTPPTPSGERTQWSAYTIRQILNLLDEMSDGDARGDAETLKKAIDDARRVAVSLTDAFATRGRLAGQAADSSQVAARTTAADITSAADTADGARSAMSGGADAVAGAKGTREQLEAYERHVKAHPDSSASVRAAVAGLMDGRYTDPMNTAAGGLTPPEPTEQFSGPGSAVDAGGPGGGPSGPGSGPRNQAGAVVDADDPGRRGGPGGPTPAPTTPPAPGDRNGKPSGSPTGDKPLALDGAPGSKGGDDPDGLDRGGRATPPGAGDPDAGRPGDDPGRRRGMPGGPDDASPGSPGGSPVGGLPVGGLPVGAPSEAPLSGRPVSAMPAGTSPPPAAPAGAPPGRVSPGPGGAVPPGVGRGRDRDEKHTAAPYLHTQENGAEIVGSLPLVGPPVLGDWAPAAAPSGTGDPAAERRDTGDGGEDASADRRGAETGTEGEAAGDIAPTTRNETAQA